MKAVKPSIAKRIARLSAEAVVFLLLLEGALRLSGFIAAGLQESRNAESLRAKDSFRIMCLGESTTAGGENAYPAQLERILNSRNLGISFSVINKGIPGTTSSFILAELERNLDRYKPDMVITMMGSADFAGYTFQGQEPVNSRSVFFRRLKVYKVWNFCAMLIRNKGRMLVINETKDEPEARSAEPERTAAENGKPAPSPEDKEKAREHVRRGQALKEAGRSSEGKQEFEKALECNPYESGAYVGLGAWYVDAKDFAKAEKAFKTAIRLDPGQAVGYVALGWLYKDRKAEGVEELFLKALEIDPRQPGALGGLGWFYEKTGRNAEAEELFKQAIESDPSNAENYIGLAQTYVGRQQYALAEAPYKKAIEIDPKNSRAYSDLGRMYQFTNDPRAEEMLRKAIEVNPRQDIWAWVALGHLYKDQGRYAESERVFKDGIQLHPENDWLYGGLVSLYEKTKDLKAAQVYREQADRLRSRSSANPATAYNYLRLKRILDGRGIQYVCMQYPLRSIKPLKDILSGEQGVIFVSNDELFKEALKREGEKGLFVDMCSGDFGHCTPKGNRLLAEHLADVLISEYFSRHGRHAKR